MKPPIPVFGIGDVKRPPLVTLIDAREKRLARPRMPLVVRIVIVVATAIGLLVLALAAVAVLTAALAWLWHLVQVLLHEAGFL